MKHYVLAFVTTAALFLLLQRNCLAQTDAPEKAASPSALTEALGKECPPIAFVKRHHLQRPFGVGTIYCWNVYKPGGGIYVYDPAQPKEPPREIFRRDNGVVFDMSPSFDGKRLLFSWMAITPDEQFQADPDAKQEAGCTPGYKRNIDSFHIFEMNSDGSGLRQITRGRFHDVHPIYLPDGRIAFTSTRVKSYSMCQPGLSSALFTMDADGGDMRRIDFGTLAGLSPFVLENGSILFMRWEYNDKSLFDLQSLWTINPDGTRLRLFYGNTVTNPNVIWQAKQIPGTATVLCTLGPHHGNPVGALGIIDPQYGVENLRGLKNITPEYAYGPSRKYLVGGGPGDKQYVWAFRDPYPVSKDLFLAAYGGPAKDGPNRYRIVALNAQGERTTVLEDPDISCFNPVPLGPRTRPKVIPSTVNPDLDYGTFFVSDVYRGLLDRGIQRGQVKAIRIMTQVPKPCNMRGQRVYDHDPLVGRGSYYVKGCYGTVAVEADGSAYFKAPAGVELYFEAVDADGKELSRMGSVTQIMPGEYQGCVGCHEPRSDTTVSRPTSAAGRRPSEIEPPPWGQPGPVDFVRHVQPVFDKYCVKCHAGPAPDGDLDLSDDKTRYFNMAYEELLAKKLVHFIWVNRGGSENLRPGTTGSHVSRLTEYLENGHGDVKVDDNGRRRIYTWIDANCPYYATYDATRPGTPGSRGAWTGTKVPGLLKELKVRATDADVNLTHPKHSRVLRANLARSADGLAEDDKARFKSTTDPAYRQLLGAIEDARTALYTKPRVDMPGAEPIPYPTDYGGLYTGFAGP
ncbi:MAG: PD40 domain-containing protein [Candidatus Nealsonbacteria bacterium]|nr:PD40 domain-containing protein [Candidatus Nealsonbacteria bacterium]